MNKNKIMARVLLALVLFTGFGSAQAMLIGVTDHGSDISDAGTGLDWMDVTMTAGMSEDDVSAQLGCGSSFV